MKKQLEKIAAKSLDLETLETRSSDSLDFHDTAVWQIKEALEAAYQAGKKDAGKIKKAPKKIEAEQITRDEDAKGYQDEKDPRYLFSTTERALLIAIIDGDLDAKKLAAEQLGNRGYGRGMKWLGFEAAAKLWNKIVSK